MSLVDRKTRTRARRARAGAHPRRQPAAGTRDLEGIGAPEPEATGARVAVAAPAPSSVPQRPAPQITKEAPIAAPAVAAKLGQPAPEREPPDFGWLVLLGAVFGVAVLKELFGRIGGPVVVKVKALPRLPASFWIAGGVGTLARLGARVLGRPGGT